MKTLRHAPRPRKIKLKKNGKTNFPHTRYPEPFNSGVTISHGPLALRKQALLDPKPSVPGTVFLVQDAPTGELDVGLRPLTLWENFCSCS